MVVLAAFIAMFLVREIFTRNMGPHVGIHLGGTSIASHFVNCVNAQSEAGNRTSNPQFGTPHTARLVAQNEDFAVVTGGRDTVGRWIVIVDFRGATPMVYDARQVVDRAVVAVQHGLSNFGTTSAFRACGADYAGLVPAPVEEWAGWFGDPFFEDHGAWSTRR